MSTPMRNASDRKKYSTNIDYFSPFLNSLSLSFHAFSTRWKMFANNKMFGGQCWKVGTQRQRHKSEVVIGKEKEENECNECSCPLFFTILLFTRATASPPRGIFTREYLEIPPFYPFHFACVENFRNVIQTEK